MAFFDKKQEVIDIKLTPFGKGLLARGFFKPVYYRFFDDEILYNSECANILEEQNRSEERILESQRLKTQHLAVGVDTRFDQNQGLINSGSLKTFMEISKRQDPLIADKILKYPLERSLVNSVNAPRFSLSVYGQDIKSSNNDIEVEGITIPVPQLQMTASYTIIENRLEQIKESELENLNLADSERYIDLSSDKIQFLDKTYLKIDGQDIIIDIEELDAEYGLDNFEIEIFEILEEGTKRKIIKLDEEKEVKKYFDIKTDSMVPELSPSSQRGRKTPKGRVK